MRNIRGFTMLELIVALLIGVVIMMSATTFAVTTVRSVEANRHREGVHRNARFVGLSAYSRTNGGAYFSYQPAGPRLYV